MPEAIREQNAVLGADTWQRVFELTPDLAYLLGPDGAFLEVNPQVCRVLRQPREKVVGQRISQFLDRDNAPLTERVLRDIVERRTAERSTRVFQLPGTEPQVFEVFEYPWLRDGKVWAIAGIGREITQEITLERRLWDTAETRQAAVDFALRTSLGLVKGYVYTLSQHQAMDEARRDRYVHIIEGEIDRLAKIIEDLLDVRRLESGMQDFAAEIVNLAECVNFAVRHCQAEANRREIIMRVEVPPVMSPLYASQEALSRVIFNLLQNAIHHTMHSGEIRLEVQETDAYVEVVVKDNGAGIPESDLPYIFDKFYRGKNSTASLAQGTGLGLMIARTFVEAMGGRILVSSRVGQGSEFRVVLPRRPVDNPDDVSLAAMTPSRTQAMAGI